MMEVTRETKVVTKPMVQIKDAFLSTNNKMVGKVLNHPNHSSGSEVVTSRILKIEGNRVETRNTIYQVENWIQKNTDKWLGKVIYDREGVYKSETFETSAEALAYTKGFEAAREICEEEDENPLEDYSTCADQWVPHDE